MIYLPGSAEVPLIHIRNAREGEAEMLSEIGLRAWQKAMASIGESDAMRDAARNAFRNFTANTWLTVTVVEQKGYVAGWAAREALDETISDFWIDPAFARQGLGSALLERIEKDVAEQGFEKVTLQTHSGNAEAIGFFRKHGYSIHWLSVAYNPKLDRDVPSVGLVKRFADDGDGAYGPGA
jgi:ribosomal-protein-alanine N-acetyltransferase